MTTIARNAPLSYYDLNTSPDIIVQQSYMKMWDVTKDEAPFVALLNMLPAHPGRNTKKMNFAVGDYFQQALTLSAAVVPNTDTDITFTSTGDFLYEGDLVYLFLTASKLYSLIRIGSRISAGRYYFTVMATNDAGTTSFTTAGTTCKLSSSSVSWHGDARPFNDKKGDVAYNWAQRMRDTVGKSDYDEINTLVDNTMQGLTRRGWKFFNKKLETALLTNMIARGGVNETGEFGITGGLPYFLNPHDAIYSDDAGIRTVGHETIQGQNKVVKASTFTFADIRNWMRYLTEYGGKDKIAIVPDNMYEMFYSLIESNVSVTRTDLKLIAPELPYAWEVNRANFGFGNLFLLRDKSLNDTPMVVKDDTDNTIIADVDKWFVAVDKDYIGMAPYINAKGKSGAPHISSIDRINNDSVEKVEFEAAFSLEVTEPRAMGYFGLDTST